MRAEGGDHAVIDIGRDDGAISGAKAVADSLRSELGFLSRSAFVESAAKDELLVASDSAGQISGFVRFHHRKDRCTTLYEIGVLPKLHHLGLGHRLMDEFERGAVAAGSLEIRLKCPVDLAANDFYRALGYQMVGWGSIEGRRRRLIQWRKLLPLYRPIEFVASFTSSTNDLMEMVQVWEREMGKVRPFDRCIFTPLFIDPGALSRIRYIHDAWGVAVMFDSGGFFVQQGKIRYEDLYIKLLEFYRANRWAEVYVLPDHVPTSRHEHTEVWERVQVTAAEGVRFFNRLPDELKSGALGVLQGHDVQQLQYCFESYRAAGVSRVGFGSFDTRGVNNEINIVTERARARLDGVHRMLREEAYTDRRSEVSGLHLFGVGAPRLLIGFREYGVGSFDSSGWQRTAGYGNVYLPFMPRRNITHGSSSISLGPGLRVVDFYRTAEYYGHACAFCEDFKRLQKDRFARMWHNAIVLGEMLERVNEAIHVRSHEALGGSRLGAASSPLSHPSRFHA